MIDVILYFLIFLSGGIIGFAVGLDQKQNKDNKKTNVSRRN